MKAPISVWIVLFEGFSLGSFSAIVESMRVANYLAGSELFSVSYASPAGGLVASAGLSKIQTVACGEVIAQSRDLVIFSEQEELDVTQLSFGRALAKWATSLKQAGVSICGMGTGIFRLAQLSMLRDRPVSVPWFYLDAFNKAFPDHDVRASLMELEQPVMTCVGGIATLDFMLHFITQTQGQTLAADVADYMVYEGKREPSTAQRALATGFPRSTDKTMARILSMVEKNPYLHPQEIASQLKMSKRQIERICQKNIRCSPGQLLLKLRLERARSLLRKSDKTVLEIATMCGFPSQSHFSQRYKRYFGTSPRSDRANPVGVSLSTRAHLFGVTSAPRRSAAASNCA